MLQREQRPLKAWLCLTARNTALNKLRQLQRAQSVELDEKLAADWTLEPRTTEAEEMIETLVNAMEPTDKESFIRKYYLMEPARKIGKLLGMTENTINTHPSRRRAKLKQQFLRIQQNKEGAENA